MSTQYIINPKTNRKIQVGGRVWKSLTFEEKCVGENMYLEKTPHREEKTVTQTSKRKKKIIVLDEDEDESIPVVLPDRRITRSDEKEEKSECNICTELVRRRYNTTTCCKQILCQDCYTKMNTETCPYCRSPDPIGLPIDVYNKKRRRINRENTEEINRREHYDRRVAEQVEEQVIMQQYIRSIGNERETLIRQISEYSARNVVNVGVLMDMVIRLYNL
jgi:hypothetical protein